MYESITFILDNLYVENNRFYILYLILKISIAMTSVALSRK